MKKFLICFLFIWFMMTVSPVRATVETTIEQSVFSKNSLIAVSVKDIKTSKTLYGRNQNILVLPASTLKIFTVKPSLDALGKDYTFKTTVWKDTDKNLYIKLSGNPLFLSSDLKTLLAKVAEKEKNSQYKNIFIDDSILDSYYWGLAWSWDDSTDDGMPKFGAYNINNNVVPIEITVNKELNKTEIHQPSNYKISIVNLLNIGKTTNIIPVRQNNVVYLTGTISNSQKILIPVENITEYFISELNNILGKLRFKYECISFGKVPQNAILITKHEQEILPIITDILKNSNNFYAETVFKIAGGYTKGTQGSIVSAIDMFNNYYGKLGIYPEEISIVDGSGVSRKNMLTADWATGVLTKFSQESDFAEFKKYLPKPSQGTLKNRLLQYDEVLNAKTGTLEGISGIAGYLTTEKGTNVAFAIYIQNFKYKSNYAKKLEDEIINEIYRQY